MEFPTGIGVVGIALMMVIKELIGFMKWLVSKNKKDDDEDDDHSRNGHSQTPAEKVTALLNERLTDAIDHLRDAITTQTILLERINNSQIETRRDIERLMDDRS